MMKRARLLLTVVLIAAFTLPSGTGYAQNNPKVLRIASTTEPPLLLDYFDSGASYQVSRIYMQPQWGQLADGTVIPILVDEMPTNDTAGKVQTADGKTVISFKIAD